MKDLIKEVNDILVLSLSCEKDVSQLLKEAGLDSSDRLMPH